MEEDLSTYLATWVVINVGLGLAVAGALLAVPLLATFKIVCDHVQLLSPVGTFLAR